MAMHVPKAYELEAPEVERKIIIFSNNNVNIDNIMKLPVLINF